MTKQAGVHQFSTNNGVFPITNNGGVSSPQSNNSSSRPPVSPTNRQSSSTAHSPSSGSTERNSKWEPPFLSSHIICPLYSQSLFVCLFVCLFVSFHICSMFAKRVFFAACIKTTINYVGTNQPSARTLKSLVPAATKTTVSLRMEDRWMGHPHFQPSCLHHRHLDVHSIPHQQPHLHILVFQELRLSGPNNRKTKRCNKYWSATGFCLYGIRCDYIHSEKEEQRKEKTEPKVKNSNNLCRPLLIQPSIKYFWRTLFVETFFFFVLSIIVLLQQQMNLEPRSSESGQQRTSGKSPNGYYKVDITSRTFVLQLFKNMLFSNRIQHKPLISFSFSTARLNHGYSNRTDHLQSDHLDHPKHDHCRLHPHHRLHHQDWSYWTVLHFTLPKAGKRPNDALCVWKQVKFSKRAEWAWYEYWNMLMWFQIHHENFSGWFGLTPWWGL